MHWPSEARGVHSGGAAVSRRRVSQMRGLLWQNGSLRRIAIAVLLQMAAETLALRDVMASIPKVVSSGDVALLSCRWNLDDGETLYSVKWYRSMQEFYRYLPKELPHTRVFSHDGINVDLSKSGEHQVVLIGLTRNLTGYYKCEVSADSPSFHTDQSSSYMHVVDLPEGAPAVWAEKAWYSVGDLLRANCTSPPADPPASIAWMVNGRMVTGVPFIQSATSGSLYKEDPIKTETTKASTAGLRSSWMKRPSTSVLELQITPEYFDTGKIKLTCIASVHTIFSAKAELELQEEKPQIASVLDTRDAEDSINSGRAVPEPISTTFILLSFAISLR